MWRMALFQNVKKLNKFGQNFKLNSHLSVEISKKMTKDNFLNWDNFGLSIRPFAKISCSIDL